MRYTSDITSGTTTSDTTTSDTTTDDIQKVQVIKLVNEKKN